MGLFEDFDIDMDDVEEATGFATVPDGTYEFEIAEGYTQNGSSNFPNDKLFFIKYSLDEAGSTSERFVIGQRDDEDSEYEITERAKQSLGFLKTRLKSLGFEKMPQDASELEGIRGTLKLVTTKSKKGGESKEYQNVKDVKVTPKAAAKKPAVKTSTKAAAPAAADEDENPFG
mgnify:CR=1 FL=1|tara:strand:- start:37380 stop:37898 length:519 start_codon:yes stop_codon:yes gene_type:complete